MLSSDGTDCYIINKQKKFNYEFDIVKEEIDGQQYPKSSQLQHGKDEDYMYMKLRLCIFSIALMISNTPTTTVLIGQDVDMNKSENNPTDLSTCGALHSIGSDLTRTRGKSHANQNGSALSDQTISKRRDHEKTNISLMETEI